MANVHALVNASHVWEKRKKAMYNRMRNGAGGKVQSIALKKADIKTKHD